MKKLMAGLTAGLLMFGSLAWAENEAIFNASTGAVNIPKVSVGSYYYNVDMTLQPGPGLVFGVKDAVPSISSSSENVAIYTPGSPGSLHIPTVIVGDSSYTVDMTQGEGLNFSVTGATAIIPSAQYTATDMVGTWTTVIDMYVADGACAVSPTSTGQIVCTETYSTGCTHTQACSMTFRGRTFAMPPTTTQCDPANAAAPLLPSIDPCNTQFATETTSTNPLTLKFTGTINGATAMVLTQTKNN